MLYSILFPSRTYSVGTSYILLFLRLVFGILFMMHGIDKVENFSELSASFPEVLGISSKLSLILVIFAELICSIAVVIGFMFRLALLPMIVAMSVAFGVVHHGSVAQGELSLIYLLIFLLMMIVGPGRYAIDTPLGAYINYKDDTCVTKN